MLKIFGLIVISKSELEREKQCAEDKAKSILVDNLVELFKQKDKIIIDPMIVQGKVFNERLGMIGNKQIIKDCYFVNSGIDIK
jgi:hypothetical protein